MLEITNCGFKDSSVLVSHSDDCVAIKTKKRPCGVIFVVMIHAESLAIGCCINATDGAKTTLIDKECVIVGFSDYTAFAITAIRAFITPTIGSS